MPVKKHLSTVLPLMLFPLLLATGCQHVVSMDNYALTKADQNSIETYLAEEIIKPAYGGKIFSAHRVLLSDRQEGKIYLWAFIQEYYREIGELQKGTGVSVPVVLNVAEENNSLKIRGHLLPGNGNQFPEDIDRLFPKQIRKQILDYPLTEGIHELVAEVEAKVQAAVIN